MAQSYMIGTVQLSTAAEKAVDIHTGKNPITGEASTFKVLGAAFITEFERDDANREEAIDVLRAVGNFVKPEESFVDDPPPMPPDPGSADF